MRWIRKSFSTRRVANAFVVRQLVPMARLSRVTITVIDFDARIAHGIVSYAKGEFNDGVDYPLDPLITPHNDRESSARNSIDPRRLRLAASLRIGKAARAESRYVCVVPMRVRNELIGSINIG